MSMRREHNEGINQNLQGDKGYPGSPTENQMQYYSEYIPIPNLLFGEKIGKYNVRNSIIVVIVIIDKSSCLPF